MTRQGSERPDKGKGVARPTKRQRQAPNLLHPSPPPAAHPSTTPTVDPSPPPAAHPFTTPAADPLPPPVIATPTPLPDPTSIPSSSSVPPSETVTPLVDPDSSGEGEGMPAMQDSALTGWVKKFGTLY
ncbi:proline-rich receptor-like protein kinase PERK8 [Vigna angularis]|uniref:proline-rich receptor-like protein kinase PERK8 n=1 Tax=Phaseolus angularis TaxID=3914 RepID=UPI0022B3F09F|nr:proline-rich receptor-like protein kinase PERK8 [Vigna angularis]